MVFITQAGMATFTVIGKGQSAYQHGRLMCTTACMCMAVSFLSRQILPFSVDMHRIAQQMGYIMQLASSCHAGKGMISAAEALKEINLDRLGLKVREFVTFFPSNPGVCEESEPFFVPWNSVVQSIIGTASKEKAVAALITCNGHTVCIMVQENTGGTCFFDPMPGMLLVCNSGSSDIIHKKRQFDVMDMVRDSLVISATDSVNKQFDVTVMCKA